MPKKQKGDTRLPAHLRLVDQHGVDAVNAFYACGGYIHELTGEPACLHDWHSRLDRHEDCFACEDASAAERAEAAREAFARSDPPLVPWEPEEEESFEEKLLKVPLGQRAATAKKLEDESD